jgi:hypothetical protein
MLTSARAKALFPLVALPALFWLPGEATAQFVYPQQHFDPNAINAMLAAQQSTSSGRLQRGMTSRGRLIGSVTGSGFLAQPLVTVSQFGPNAYSDLLNVNPLSGASGVAGGAAVGMALAAQANLIHEPAGVQINAMYNSPINQRWGFNVNPIGVGSAFPNLGTLPYNGFGANPYGGFGSLGGIPTSRGY